MATIEELGRKVKAKFPGQYDDLGDVELGQRVKAKYPREYGDFTDISDANRALAGTGLSVSDPSGPRKPYALAPKDEQKRRQNDIKTAPKGDIVPYEGIG